MQEKSREQGELRSPSQLAPQIRPESTSTTMIDKAAGNSQSSSMPYIQQSFNFNKAWAAHQQQQYNDPLDPYKTQQLQLHQQHQHQQHQHQHQQSGLGVHGYNPYPAHFDSQDPSALSYQSNAYYGNGLNGSNQASSSYTSQHPHYQQYQPSQASFPSLSRQIQAVKSPREQFTDTLRRGVQNFTFTPAGSITSDSKNTESRRSTSQVASLPARPDSAIRAAQSTSQGGGEVEILMQSTSSNNSQSSRGAMTTAAVLGSTSVPVSLPPRPAPSLPLATRFQALPPKPPLRGESTSDEKELYKKFEAREDALLLRVDALGFQPEAAWQVMNEVVDGRKLDESGGAGKDNRESAAPILGIRLLQRLDLLQKENEELEAVFSKRMEKVDDGEVQDALRLLDALDHALTAAKVRAEQAEARVASLEKALAIACNVRSSAITNTSSGIARTANTSPPWQKSSPPSS